MALDSDLTAQLFDDAYTGPLDPFEIFEAWMAEAVASEVNDPNAMALASVDGDGLPDIRMVLLNGRDQRGFTFFTNMESAKGKQMLGQRKAALLFHWKSLRRQIRIRGDVEQVSVSEADAYFTSRPRAAQIGAHASAQSSPLDARTTLMQRTKQLEASFEGADVPRPAHWSGLCIKPLQIEFWKDGANRLHDRVTFVLNGTTWTRQRLNP